jgi:RHS repeat-associated protein
LEGCGVAGLRSRTHGFNRFFDRHRIGSWLSQPRYLPFSQIRANVGTIAQKDFGYTGQKNKNYTIYIGGRIYEVNKDSGGAVTGSTTYYPAAGAMRVNGTLYYTLRDQLNSASEVLDASGAIVGEQRYYPFGQVRISSPTMFTDRLYTGQRAISGLGLDFYNARYYDPSLGRFISPDSITPGGPQGLNRYSYVMYNTKYAAQRYQELDRTGRL